MQSTLLRSSFSPIVKEGLDASASLFTADGTTLSQSCSIPIHLATLIPAVAKVLETYPVDGMRDGDIYILNDPYTGGTHLPDIAVIAPVFHRGTVIALSGAMTHHQDVGGMSAGSVPTNATEIYQEGLRIPPLKLRDGGVFNDTLVKMIRQNVRIPDTVMGDLNAQVAACTVAGRRLAELADGYGHNQLASIFDELLQRSETMTRKALSAIPEGTYRFVDYLDNDGIELDKPIRIEVAVTVKGGDIEFDFEGTSPQVKGPLNCVPSGSLAAACFAVRALTDPTIPTNGGCFRPIKLRLPKGTIVNPQEPAAVNARTSTIKRITGCMIGALAQILPERVPAASAGELLVIAFGGSHPDGGRYVVGELIAGGSGASAGLDGVDVIETDATNCMNLPAEAMEMEAPIRIHRVALREGFRRRRHVPRRPRRGSRIRDPRRRGVALASRRAPLLQRRPVSTAGRRAPRPIRSSGVPAAARMSSRRRWLRRCARATVSSSRPRAAADMAIRTGGPLSRCARMCATARSARKRRALSMVRQTDLTRRVAAIGDHELDNHGPEKARRKRPN